MLLPAGVFRSVLQISMDGGKTWWSLAPPGELTDSIVDVVSNRIWMRDTKGRLVSGHSVSDVR
ncbi:hypothetical protein FSO04_18560 [Paraburkholderia madseniana]|uniref:Uncharacterized protein n=1 Tax=Paraburkholderia madseniana TaxID=2599607 RepID=A0A6N6WEI1_9BURK|nr:hypothetical protein [Paraburkholderia madseniana]KAE8758399.1 hypothetical protein FSO04_18560 [Paraburkholderia madseniana]